MKVYASNSEDIILLKSEESDKKLASILRNNDYFIHRYRRKHIKEVGTYHEIRKGYPREVTNSRLQELDIDIAYVSNEDFWGKAREINESKPISNESDIREKVKEYLHQQYKIAHIQDEYTHASLPVRADIFAVTEDAKIITVEIKSDKDNFARLKKQLDEYSTFSHIVYVALDHSHAQSYLEKHNRWNVGLLTFEDGLLDMENAPYEIPSIHAADLLWKQEWLEFTRYFDGSFSKYGINDLQKIVYNTFTASELRKISEYLFVNRYLRKQSDFKHLIADFDHKTMVARREIEKLKKEKQHERNRNRPTD